MRPSLAAILCIASISVVALSAQPDNTADSKPEKVTVYLPGANVSAPELAEPATAELAGMGCKNERRDIVQLVVVVDRIGVPTRYIRNSSLGDSLDHLALLLVAQDRFRPAMRAEQPVASAIRLEIEMQSCTGKLQGIKGKALGSPLLKSQAIQKVSAAPETAIEDLAAAGRDIQKDLAADPTNPNTPWTLVTAPLPLESVEAEYTNAARKANIEGICLISLRIDAQGNVQDPVVVKGLGYGLDEKALEAVRKYRFKPSTRGGVHVPVMIRVMVSFRQ